MKAMPVTLVGESSDKKNSKIVARIELNVGSKLPEGVELGTELEVCIRGKVVGFRAVEQSRYKDSKGKNVDSFYPGELKLEISKIEFESVGSFDGMMED